MASTTTEIVDLTTDRDIKPELLDAIESAKGDTLRRILIQLCKTSTVCASHIEEAMLVPTAQLESATADASSTEGTKKRKLENKRPRFAHCIQCRDDYDIVLNQQPGQEQACRRHTGTLEMDDDAFPDDDDIQYQGHRIDVNTDWRVDEFPEEFTWSCCQQQGKGAEPCVRSRHSQTTASEEKGKVFWLADGEFGAETESDEDASDNE